MLVSFLILSSSQGTLEPAFHKDLIQSDIMTGVWFEISIQMLKGRKTEVPGKTSLLGHFRGSKKIIKIKRCQLGMFSMLLGPFCAKQLIFLHIDPILLSLHCAITEDLLKLFLRASVIIDAAS